MGPDAPRGTDFAARLLHWFDRHGRHDLPWQHPRDPYRVWLSEVMLQQTQVAVAIPYFQRFVASLPTLAGLAAAPRDQVLALWSGLGYYSRARNLHAAAQQCMERHGGELPRDFDALLALPGIGRSTAGAILSQAWGQRFAILDGNVRRVLARWRGIAGWPGEPAVQKQLWTLAERLLPAARMADYTQAQMDLGATVCTRSNPACPACPLRADCVAFAQGRTGELPAPRPAKQVPTREGFVLLLQRPDGRVWLHRRPDAGVWAALWSLPEAADADGAAQWLDRHAGLHVGDADTLPVVDHAFSHYRLRLTPLRLRVASGYSAVDPCMPGGQARWVHASELDAIGIPAPIRRLLEQALRSPGDDRPRKRRGGPGA